MPPRRVALVLEGSRGDQQPYIVAGLALKEAGYDVLILCTSDAEDMAMEHGLRFKSYGISAKEMTQSPKMVKAVTENDFAKLSAAANDLKAEKHGEMLELVINELKKFQVELIISSALNLTGCVSVGKGLGVPVILLALQVMVPSNYIPALGVLPRLPSFLNLNWFAWKFVMEMVLLRQSQKEFLQHVCPLLGCSEDELKLPFEEMCDHCSCRPRFPVLFAVSLGLHGPFPADFNQLCRPLGPLMFRPDQQVGADFGTEETQRLGVFMQKCNASNERPVYMGFGSMICEGSKFMTLLCVRALMSCQKPGVILSGWAELSLKDVEGEDDSAELQAFCCEKVIFLAAAAHGQLFPECSVIVHHGGAGTTYAAAMSGAPSVVLPVLLDQYQHSDLVNRKSIGVGLKSMRSTTVSELSAAITKCQQSTQIQKAAAAMAQTLAKEDGSQEVVRQVDQFFIEFVDTGRYFQEKERSKEAANQSFLSWLAGKCRSWICCVHEKGS